MRTNGIKMTRFELELMEALWTLGPASVREIQEYLPEEDRPAYTTVQTMVYRLEEKGALRRVKKIGNAHVFEPAITRAAAQRRVLDEVLDVFGGSARPLMAHLVESGRLTLADIRELERTLEQLESAPATEGGES
ncbi:MAG TPA: BlaI/MecI/CopY family transcriptional regulator [Blastocatellia bacterium]|nr:BlaI/MecI/CopY family transcriptional regulator [Blastocatellia bacterium]